jgi:hypothetical protein
MVSCKNSKRSEVEYIKSYGIFPPKNASPVLLSYMQKSADEQKIKIYGHRVLNGAHTDSVPFHLRKYESIDIISLSGTKYSHSKNDTTDKINSQVLLETCKIVQRLISMLDDN